MEGGLTRNEQTLIERGHEDLVRTYRLRFQEAMEGPTVEAIQRITGRRARYPAEHRATTCAQPASTAAGMSAYSRKNRSQTRM
jgi:hypothetical protein